MDSFQALFISPSLTTATQETFFKLYIGQTVLHCSSLAPRMPSKLQGTRHHWSKWRHLYLTPQRSVPNLCPHRDQVKSSRKKGSFRPSCCKPFLESDRELIFQACGPGVSAADVNGCVPVGLFLYTWRRG